MALFEFQRCFFLLVASGDDCKLEKAMAQLREPEDPSSWCPHRGFVVYVSKV